MKKQDKKIEKIREICASIREIRGFKVLCDLAALRENL
jgi:hypothetical protein